MVEISDAGSVRVQRCVSPTVSIASRGPVDCAAMYADSYHITTDAPTRNPTNSTVEDGIDSGVQDNGSNFGKASITLGSSV